VLVLTQQANEVLSPALPLLLLGLPIADILAVFVLRARGGMNLFRATRNHIHHRLLELGFYHYEAVIIIYSIHILFIVCAILMPYGHDWVIISIYLSVCAAVFVALTYAERRHWKVNRSHDFSDGLISRIPHKDILVRIPSRGLEAGVSLFLIAAAFMSNTIPFDIGISSLVLFAALLFVSFTGRMGTPAYRLVIFVTVGFAVYLLSTYPPEWLLTENHLIYTYFGLITVFAFFAARLMVSEQFQITPLDYLVIMMALIIGFAQGSGFESTDLVWMVIQIIILFYACELTIQNMQKRLNGLTGSAIVALALIALRGLT
jgi:UDP-GlcNAc:undecaprenyl-phosphate GlcNAc-1-phosphate transferase